MQSDEGWLGPVLSECKIPGGFPPGIAWLMPGSLRRSWIEVALPAEHRGPDVLVGEEGHRGTRPVRDHHRIAFERGVETGVHHLQTDIELRHRVPLGAGIGFPEAVVRRAVVTRGQSESRHPTAGGRGDAASRWGTRDAR